MFIEKTENDVKLRIPVIPSIIGVIGVGAIIKSVMIGHWVGVFLCLTTILFAYMLFLQGKAIGQLKEENDEIIGLIETLANDLLKEEEKKRQAMSKVLDLIKNAAAEDVGIIIKDGQEDNTKKDTED